VAHSGRVGVGAGPFSRCRYATRFGDLAILSNVDLHHVVDEWFTEVVRPRLRGPGTLVRFCDDFVMLFSHREDAERVLAVLGKRLGRFGLQLHPDKTRLVDFRPRRGPSDCGESSSCGFAQGVQSTVPAHATLAA
jgi:hypothetical protein